MIFPLFAKDITTSILQSVFLISLLPSTKIQTKKSKQTKQVTQKKGGRMRVQALVGMATGRVWDERQLPCPRPARIPAPHPRPVPRNGEKIPHIPIPDRDLIPYGAPTGIFSNCFFPSLDIPILQVLDESSIYHSYILLPRPIKSTTSYSNHHATQV